MIARTYDACDRTFTQCPLHEFIGGAWARQQVSVIGPDGPGLPKHVAHFARALRKSVGVRKRA
eukprot:4916972-Alexandrium_andersonii.AAC.1